MFKDENDFEKIVDRLKIDTEPNLAHREKLRRQMLTAFEEKQPVSRKIVFRTLRRTIMRNPLTKLAAAAAIITVVLIGINYLGGSIDGTNIAWAQVVQEISNHTRYKCRQRVVRQQGPQTPTMEVYHLNLQQRRQEVEDENGTIHIIDMRGEDAVTVELDPTHKKAVVTELIGIGPRHDPDIIEMVKQYEQVTTEKLGTKKSDGKTLQGFRYQPNEYNDFKVWVDTGTKLPVEIELIHPQVGQTIFLDDFEFDFDLDPSAFSTEVPDGYEVQTITQDYRPVESKQITPEDIRAGLNHTSYTIEKLPWIEKLIIIQTVDPLMRMGKVYMTGILSDDGNNIIIDQSNMQHDYKEAMMQWILNEQLVIETPSGAKLYTHPRGSDYARLYLEGFAKAAPDFFNIDNLSEDRFARMIVMPDGTIMGLSANKQITDEKLEQLVESLTEIQ